MQNYFLKGVGMTFWSSQMLSFTSIVQCSSQDVESSTVWDSGLELLATTMTIVGQMLTVLTSLYLLKTFIGGLWLTMMSGTLSLEGLNVGEYFLD